MGREGPALGKELRHLAAHHEMRHADRVECRGGPRRHHPAVTQHRDPVRDGRNLRQAMGNIEDRDAARLQAADDGEERLGLDGRERRRRLVEDDDAVVHLERAGDLHELPLRDRKPRHGPAWLELRPERPHGLRGPAVHGAVVHHEPAPDLPPHEDVAGHREVGRQQDFLVDQHDPASLGVDRPGETDRFARDRDGAAGRREMAGQQLHQSRLAGAVLSDDGMHFAGHQVERDVAQHLDWPEALRDAAGLQGRNGVAASGFD